MSRKQQAKQEAHDVARQRSSEHQCDAFKQLASR
jgi:hypothetical protein